MSTQSVVALMVWYHNPRKLHNRRRKTGGFMRKEGDLGFLGQTDTLLRVSTDGRVNTVRVGETVNTT